MKRYLLLLPLGGLIILLALSLLSPPRAESRTIMAEIRAATVEAAISVQRSGKASWYCGNGSPCTRDYPPGSMVAAAGPELRVGDWRGSWVTVAHQGKSVRVQLVDWCGCPGRRIIDLYRAPFAQLADPSRGVIDVTIEIGGPGPTLPPTDSLEDRP